MKLLKYTNDHSVNLSLGNIMFKRGANVLSLEDKINDAKNLKEILSYLEKNTHEAWYIDEDKYRIQTNVCGNNYYLIFEKPARNLEKDHLDMVYKAFIGVIDALTVSEDKRLKAKRALDKIFNTF